MIYQRRVFLLNNVYFDQKLVSLYSNIRLLERDERIILDRDHVTKRLITFYNIHYDNKMSKMQCSRTNK